MGSDQMVLETIIKFDHKQSVFKVNQKAGFLDAVKRLESNFHDPENFAKPKCRKTKLPM